MWAFIAAGHRGEDQDPIMVGGEGKTIADVAQGHLNLVSLRLFPPILI